MRGAFIPQYTDRDRHILISINQRKVSIFDLRDNTYHETTLYKNHLNEFFYSRFKGKTKMHNKRDLIQLSLEEVFNYGNKIK